MFNDTSKFPDNFKLNELLQTLIKEQHHEYQEPPHLADIQDLKNVYYSQYEGLSPYRMEQPEPFSIETSVIFGDSDRMSNASTRFLAQNPAISALRKRVQDSIQVHLYN